MNKAFLMGRLTRDPEVRYSQNNLPITTFTLAVDRRFVRQGEERQADFIPVVAFGKTAEFCEKYYRKGQMVLIMGRIQVRTWDDNEGKRRYVTEIVCEEAHFADSKRQDGGGASARPDDFGYYPQDRQADGLDGPYGPGAQAFSGAGGSGGSYSGGAGGSYGSGAGGSSGGYGGGNGGYVSGSPGGSGGNYSGSGGYGGGQRAPGDDRMGGRYSGGAGQGPSGASAGAQADGDRQQADGGRKKSDAGGQMSDDDGFMPIENENDLPF